MDLDVAILARVIAFLYNFYKSDKIGTETETIAEI